MLALTVDFNHKPLIPALDNVGQMHQVNVLNERDSY